VWSLACHVRCSEGFESPILRHFWGISSAVERLPVKQLAIGSNPIFPANFGSVAKSGEGNALLMHGSKVQILLDPPILGLVLGDGRWFATI
tara:strand:+ start:84305 stop:84577 length:273 start_codon:yes stop_codon:yes gene_type:complete